MLLNELLKDIKDTELTGADDLDITHITNDSRNCVKGSLFVAINGHDKDGRTFIKQALKGGAVAVLTDNEYEEGSKATLIQSDNPRAVQAIIAHRFYGEHPEHILAVTGTNGKSSVVHFVREILGSLDKKAGSIGTLGVVNTQGERLRGDLTTPDTVGLHQALANLKKEGADYAVIEASSHGLDQQRLADINVGVAAFTHLSHDHLDYHETEEKYLEAKLKLFGEVMQKGAAIINADSKQAAAIKKISKSHAVTTYGKKGDIKLLKTEPSLDGLKVSFEAGGAKFDVDTKLVGDFQAQNLLCAVGMVAALGIEIADIVKVCAGIVSVKGRMDVVATTPLGAPVVVDYAHTPDALETVLKALRPHVKGKIVLVFGCGGERDEEKRPEMGKIAAKHADVVVVTDDNPRMESSETIRTAILAECKGGIGIPNRKEAIIKSVDMVGESDLLLIAGKGHEDYQLVGRRRYRFDDGEVARRAIGSPLWTAKQVADATAGDAKTADWTAYGISIDTRTLKKGDMFVALKGENFDGHDYVKEALEKGAVAAIVSKAVKGLTKDAAIVKVKNTQKALEALAADRRKASEAKFVAVTGSVGKTSVKDALAVILGYQGRTHSTQQNLNNQIGLPLSLARMPLDAVYGVFELAMSKKGEISMLTKLLRPHVAVITSIEAVHLENFKSVVEIADAKAEVFEGLEKGGTAVIPYDSSMLTRLASAAHDKKIDNILSFGVGEFARYRLTGGREYNDGVKLEMSCNETDLNFKISLLGRHNALNATAVMAALDAVGADLRQAARTYIKVRASNGRGRVHRLKIEDNRVTLIDDSYNASPASMKAALDVLGTVGYDTRGRLVAVLGDMLELGKTGPEFHKQLAERIVSNDVKVVITAGELMQNLHDALPDTIEKQHVKTSEDILPLLKEKTERGDVILLKGSHGSNIWQLAEALKSEGR